MNAAHQGNTGSCSSSTNYIMSKDSTDYIGDFVYHNNRLSRYNWGNGYIVPAGSLTVGTGHCHLSLAFYQDYTLTQKMNVLVCILIQNTRIM